MANRALDEIGWSGVRVTQVADMIRATATHLPTLDADTDVLLAADLAVLAAEPAAYSDYVRGVRKEYAHIDEAGWAAGRSAVLRSLLDLDRIYSAALELDTWETRARANITAELAGLLPP